MMPAGSIANAQRLIDPDRGGVGASVSYTFYQNLPSFYNGVRLPQNDGASPSVLYTDPGVFVPLSPSEVSAVTGMMGQIQALVNINFIHTVGVEAVWFDGNQTWLELDNIVAAYGTVGGDGWLEGTEGDDDVYALAGDDSIVGRGGNDRLFGGEGYDQANYFGDSTDFSFVLNLDGTVTVTDLVGDEGADILDSVEALWFAGHETWMSIEDAVSGAGSLQAQGVGGMTVLVKGLPTGDITPEVRPALVETESKAAGPQVQPAIFDGGPSKGAEDPVICWTGPGEDFVFKPVGGRPLVRPAEDPFEFSGRASSAIGHGWQTFLPEDGDVGADTGLLFAHGEDGWML